MFEGSPKSIWLGALSDFLVEANKNTWASDAPEIESQRPGYKGLDYPYGGTPETSTWYLRDSYTGYFRAPGMTTVYYKGVPSWTMAYGGRGMNFGKYPRVEETFEFLKQALMQVTPELPFRGPARYRQGLWVYSFKIEGDIEECTWIERITEDDNPFFSQSGFAGIIINKTPDRKAQNPWEL